MKIKSVQQIYKNEYLVNHILTLWTKTLFLKILAFKTNNHNYIYK